MVESQIRASKELRDIINFVRAKYILAGKRPPSCRKITQAIAKKINKEELLHNEFIKF
jgi:sulfur relay (sulfurtransferase) DsrC/TusE family protein